MRMAFEHRQQDLIQYFAANAERAKFHFPVIRYDLQRRPRGGDIPARITSRIFVSGRKVKAAMAIEVLQDMLQTSAISDLGNCASNCDSVRCCKTVFTHAGPPTARLLA